MKKCAYCAKEISYHEMHCSKECEQLCNEYYEKRVKFQKLLSAVNIVGTCSIAIGLFLYALVNVVGASLMAAGGLSVGLITLLLPTPTDNMIEKHKLHKAMKIVRIFGIVLITFGAAALLLAILRYFGI